MDVHVDWTKKRTTFKVKGKTLLAVKKNLGPEAKWGRFDPMDLSSKLTLDKDKMVTDVKLFAGYTIAMPVWTDYTKAPARCKAEWDRMWKALEKHELGHAGFLVEGVVMLQLAIQEKEPGTISKEAFDALRDEHAVDLEKADKEFEIETDHGRKRGVTLDIPDECM